MKRSTGGRNIVTNYISEKTEKSFFFTNFILTLFLVQYTVIILSAIYK